MPIHLLHYVLYITKEIKEFLSYINTKLQKLHSFKRVECGSSSAHRLIISSIENPPTPLVPLFGL